MKINRHPPHGSASWCKEVRRYETCSNCKAWPSKWVNAGIQLFIDCSVDPALPWDNSASRSLHQAIEDIAPSQATAVCQGLWLAEDGPVVVTHVSFRMVACRT